MRVLTRLHARMIEDTLGEQLIGHLSRDSTAIEARESIAKRDKVQATLARPKNKRGRPSKGDICPSPEPGPLERQRNQTLAQIMAELDAACATGTKKNAQGYKISWKGYKLHLDTACCGIPISSRGCCYEAKAQRFRPHPIKKPFVASGEGGARAKQGTTEPLTRCLLLGPHKVLKN